MLQGDVLLMLEVHGEVFKDPPHRYLIVIFGDSDSMCQWIEEGWEVCEVGSWRLLLKL